MREHITIDWPYISRRWRASPGSGSGISPANRSGEMSMIWHAWDDRLIWDDPLDPDLIASAHDEAEEQEEAEIALAIWADRNEEVDDD